MNTQNERSYSSVILNAGEYFDSISDGDTKFLAERSFYELRKREILSKHKSPIKQLPNGHWYTRVKGRKIEKKNKEDLIDVVINHYLGKIYSLQALWPEFLNQRKIEVSHNTWRKDIYLYKTYILTSSLSSMFVSDIKKKDGYLFVQHCLKLKPDMTRKYWMNVIGVMNKLLDYAVDVEAIEKNPFRTLSINNDMFAPPKKKKDEDLIFSKIEQEKVCNTINNIFKDEKDSILLSINLNFNLGLRVGEVCGLKWGDISYKANGKKYIHIQRECISNTTMNGEMNGYMIVEHCKTPKGDRELLLNDKANDILNKIKLNNEKRGFPTGEDNYIFLRRYEDRITFCSNRSMDARLRRICKIAGMKTIKSFHDIRRTVLTNLIMAGMPLNQIQAYAGHSSMNQTMEYIKSVKNDDGMIEYLNAL